MPTLRLSILDRYIAGHVLVSTLLSMLVLLMLFSMLEFSYKLSHTNYSSAISETLLRMPRLCYELFPAVTAIGTMIGLGNLATGSQLVVIRTAGVSPARITLSALLGMIVLAPLVLVIGEVLVPYSEKQLKEGKNNAANGGNPIWLRSDNKMIRLGKVISQDWIEDVQIYDFDEGKLRSISHADKMLRDTDYWLLSNIKRSSFTPAGVYAERLSTQRLTLDIDSELIRVTVKYPRTLPLSQLWTHIGFLKLNGMSTDHSEVVFWSKVFFPLSLFGMMLATAPLVLGWVNTVLLGTRIMIGIFSSISFYVFSRMAEYSTLIWGLPSLVGAAAPLVMLGFVAYLLQRRLH